MLIVLGALGTMVGTTAPAEAQTPPAQVAFWTRNRSVSFTSNNVFCNDWRYDTASRVLVPRGGSTSWHDSTFTCRNLQTGWEIVADLHPHASYRADNGLASVQYELRVRVNWGGGTVWCGSAWTPSHGRHFNEGFTMFWNGTSESSTDFSYIWLDCQHQGNVGVYFRAERGFGTW